MISKCIVFKNAFDEISSLLTFFVIFYSIFVNQQNVYKSFLSLKLSQKVKFDLNITTTIDETEIDTDKKKKVKRWKKITNNF